MEKKNECVFISGIQDISERHFMEYYYPVLVEAVKDKDRMYVMSDDDGTAVLAQIFLKHEDLPEGKVLIFGLDESPRHYVSDKFIYIGGFKSIEERDAALTFASTHDLHIVFDGLGKDLVVNNLARRQTPLYDYKQYIEDPNSNQPFWTGMTTKENDVHEPLQN